MAQIDNTPGLNPGPEGPAVYAQAVTPSDGALLPMMARRLWVGGAGNITLIPRQGTLPVTFFNVPVGPLNVWTKAVLATGTTATNIVALG